MKRWIWLPALAACVGCGTFRNLQNSGDPDHGMVYGGVQREIATLNRPPKSLHREGFLHADSEETNVLLTGLDLPLSVIGDTLTLPYTLWWTLNQDGENMMPVQATQPARPSSPPPPRATVEPPRIDRP